MSDVNYDEFVDLITEHFRTTALLGDALTIGHYELTNDQITKYTQRALEVETALSALAGAIEDPNMQQQIRMLVNAGSNLRTATGSGTLYRYSAADYFQVAGKIISGLEPLPR